MNWQLVSSAYLGIANSPVCMFAFHLASERLEQQQQRAKNRRTFSVQSKYLIENQIELKNITRSVGIRQWRTQRPSHMDMARVCFSNSLLFDWIVAEGTTVTVQICFHFSANYWMCFCVWLFKTED